MTLEIPVRISAAPNDRSRLRKPRFVSAVQGTLNMGADSIEPLLQSSLTRCNRRVNYA